MSKLKLRIENKQQTLVYYERSDFQKIEDITSDVKLYNVNDKQLLPFLKKSLGVKAIVEKKREIWRKGNVVFHLDVVKNVGNILEIELRKRDKITRKDKDMLKLYQTKLLPYLGKIIKKSNVDLVLTKQNKKTER